MKSPLPCWVSARGCSQYLKFLTFFFQVRTSYAQILHCSKSELNPLCLLTISDFLFHCWVQKTDSKRLPWVCRDISGITKIRILCHLQKPISGWSCLTVTGSRLSWAVGGGRDRRRKATKAQVTKPRGLWKDFFWSPVYEWRDRGS